MVPCKKISSHFYSYYGSTLEFYLTLPNVMEILFAPLDHGLGSTIAHQNVLLNTKRNDFCIYNFRHYLPYLRINLLVIGYFSYICDKYGRYDRIINNEFKILLPDSLLI